MNFSREEQETIILFNAAEPDASVYTRDKAVMRKIDTLVTEYPDVFKCVNETVFDKRYLIPKKYVKFTKPRNLSESRREAVREQMEKFNQGKKK